LKLEFRIAAGFILKALLETTYINSKVIYFNLIG